MEPKLPGHKSEFNEIEPEFLLKAYQFGRLSHGNA